MRSVTATLLLAAALVGCGDDDQEFTESTVVATIGDATLTAGQLEAMLLQAPEAPSILQGQAVLSLWLDHAGYVVANARSEALDTPEIMNGAVAPERLRAAILALAGQTRGNRPPPTDAQVDSLATLNTVRVFERFAVDVADPTDTTAMREAFGRLMNLRRAIGELSLDTTKSIDDLPPEASAGLSRSRTEASTRGDLPPRIADMLWRLEPGMTSEVLSGQGAAQVFVRLPPGAGQEQLRRWLAGQLNLQADAVYVDSLAQVANLTIADGASERLRGIAREPIRADGEAPLVTYDGGAVSPADAREWIGLMPAAPRASVLVSSDSGLTTMLTEMGKRAIMEGIAPDASPEALAEIDTNYTERLQALSAALGEVPPNADVSARTMGWMGELLDGRRPLIPFPGSLGLILRDRYNAEVNFEALQWVVERAATAWAQRAGQAT